MIETSGVVIISVLFVLAIVAVIVAARVEVANRVRKLVDSVEHD